MSFFFFYSEIRCLHTKRTWRISRDKFYFTGATFNESCPFRNHLHSTRFYLVSFQTNNYTTRANYEVITGARTFVIPNRNVLCTPIPNCVYVCLIPPRSSFQLRPRYVATLLIVFRKTLAFETAPMRIECSRATRENWNRFNSPRRRALCKRRDFFYARPAL